MRKMWLALSMGATLWMAGCSGSGSKWGFLRNSPEQSRLPEGKPTEAQLVNYLNSNAKQIQSIECADVDLDVKSGSQSFGMQALMACRKNRNFRLKASAIGNPQADLGSNDQEFWFWIAKADPPYQYHCSYADLNNRGREIQLPFPIQPEWVMEALGMAEYDPAGQYTLTPNRGLLLLTQQSVTPQGMPVRKVTVFDSNARSRVPVRAHILQDEKGKEICSAHIADAQVIGGAVVPTRIVLSWPTQRLELKMKLNSPRLNQLDPTSATRLFTRQPLANVQAYDLVHGLDGASSQLAPVGGTFAR